MFTKVLDIITAQACRNMEQVPILVTNYYNEINLN